MARCGPKCFGDPARLAYPVCAAGAPCEVDRQGCHAAKSRAGAQHDRKVAKRVETLCRALRTAAKQKGKGSRHPRRKSPPLRRSSK